jgi:hypothetical protein
MIVGGLYNWRNTNIVVMFLTPISCLVVSSESYSVYRPGAVEDFYSSYNSDWILIT